ncbi:MAG: TIGR03905 family TSCPD domain-containing protein [Oscillospiraceae bacterium]|nr:TIGR03905 family TSCPD domain-containing protein [Oscillospiraceae bacterium]
MEYNYLPKGICPTEISVELDGSTIKRVEFINGCKGNLLGIAKLVEGMNVADAINKLKGIECGRRGTSCPDQLAKALEECCKVHG